MGGQNTIGVTLEAGIDISNILNGVKQIQGAFNGLKMPTGFTEGMAKDFEKLKESLAKFKELAGKTSFSKGDLKQLDKLQSEIDTTFSHLTSSIQELNGTTFYLDADYTKIREAEAEVDKLKKELQTKLSDIKIEISGAGGNQVSLNMSQIFSDMERGVKSSKVLSAAMKEVGESIQTGNFQTAGQQLTEIINKAGTLKGASAGLLDTFKQWGIINFSGPAKDIQSMEERAGLLRTAFELLIPLFTQDEEGIKKISSAIDEAINKKKELEQTGQINANNYAKTQAEAMRDITDSTHAATQAQKEYAQSVSDTQTQIKQLQQSTQYFFSLRNMINLLKRGIREAVQTVKDLDKAMTETAVVTTYSVGDMWAKLPEYTSNANALGATIQDMYESTTLYYQQGLNTEQAMSIATETMKMARIAGMEAAEATDMMTAALRGFNMEINETSAEHINDVYSNLAAKTASNTEELGTAMQRTASIAANAGMSFEGTAAFLAQAIETTREPAENIGTAMKTIVARFTELKKNPLEIAEVDGEEVSYNKIDTALQSIGVSLKDTNGQFRDLDKVFLDISQRWDGLSQTQQRYIATVAAGSRQQSRFIAMMSNYDRTMELMGYAHDSAGASQEQFGKTLDSLEAKLNKFQNAWKEFLMGIMNDKWTKRLVDAGTDVLNTVNKIINALSFGGKAGLLKSALSTFTAFTALKLSGKGINALIGGLGGMLDPKSSFKAGFKGGGIGSQAEKISSPIVKAIYSLIPHIDKAATGLQKNQGYGDYKNANAQIRAMLGNGKQQAYSISGLQSIFEQNDLNTVQEKVLINSLPGLKHNLTRGLVELFKESGAKPEVAKGLIAGVKKGTISLGDALIKGGVAETFSQKFERISNTLGEEQAIQFKEGAENELKNNGTISKIWEEAATKQLTPEQQDAYVKERTSQELNKKAYIKDVYAAAAGTERVLTPAEQAANAFNKLGGSLSSAGMSLQMMGAQMSALHPVIGAVVSKMGGLLTTGGSLVTMIGSIIAGGPPMWILAGAIVAIGTAFGIASIRASRAKKAAEQVIGTYKKINEETQANISTLKQYQSEVEKWSQGVDQFGNNINLSDEDYAAYVEAVDKIAEINPEIVEGYNAQGHAIININKALSETLALEKQRQDEALKDYTSDAAFDKVLRAREVDNAYQEATLTTRNDWIGKLTNGLLIQSSPLVNIADKLFGANWANAIGKAIDKTFDSNIFTQTTTAFNDDVNNIITKVSKKNQSKLTDILSDFNIDYSALLNGDALALNQFVQNRNAIYDRISKEIYNGDVPTKIGGLFDTLDEHSEAFDEATAEFTQMLQTYVSSLDAYKNIPEDFRSAINKGLEYIAIQPDLNAKDAKEQAQNLIKQFDQLTQEGSQYATIMEGVTEAQNDYAKSLNETEYTNAIQDELKDLDELYKYYSNKTDAYSQAVAEYINTQIEKIKAFPEEGAYYLTSALNEVSDTIAAANNIYSDFQEATKTDMWTGAQGMKSIYDDIFEGTHGDVKGDKTWWEGAERLLGKERLEELDYNIQAVTSDLKKMSPELQEGEAGFAAFWGTLKNANISDIAGNETGVWWDENGALQIDTTINPDAYKYIADATNRSVEYVVAQLNKGRQYADINFVANPQEVRKALGADTATIKSTEDTAAGKAIYVTQDYLDQAIEQAGYGANEVGDIRDFLIANDGIRIIPGADSLKREDFAKWNISDLPSLIKTFNDTGLFNKEQIEEYAKAYEGEAFDPEKFNTAYQHDLDLREDSTLAPIESIDSAVQRIANILDRDRIKEGDVTTDDVEQAKKEWEQNTRGEAGVNDTAIQKFGEGLNEWGEIFSPEEFKAAKATAQEGLKTAQENWDLYKQAAQAAHDSGDAVAEARANEAAGYWENIAKSYQSNLDEAGLKWAQAYTEQARQNAIQQSIDNGMSVSQANLEGEEAYNEALQQAADALNTGVDNLAGEITELNKNKEPSIKNDTGVTNTSDKPSTSISTDSNYQPDWNEVKEGAKDLFHDLGSVWTNFIKEGETSKASNKTPSSSEPTKTDTIHTDTVQFKTENSEEVKQTENEVKDKADEGATHITKFESQGEGEIKKLTDTKTQTKTVKLNTDTSSVNAAGSKPLTKSIQIEDGLAMAKINRIDNAAKKTVTKTINVSPNYTGTWEKKVYVGLTGPGAKQGGYTGLNNKISYHHVPMAGSAAGGTKKGRLGPRNQGGMTLTGELGYEVAWLPSEGRSVVLGADGPQMVNLPKDATVYNHEQSKEIMKKKKSITAGSMGYAAYSGTVTNYSSTGTAKSKNSGSSKSKASKKKKNINNFSIEEVIRFDIDQTLAKLNSDIAKKSKQIEKSLGKIGTVYSNIKDSVQKQLQALQDVKANNQALVDSYKRQLNAIDTGTYEQVVSWTNNKGKSQEAVYNLAKYIYKDAQGVYKVDTNKIKTLGSNAEREAVFKAASGAIEGLQSGLLKAQEAVDDADEKMAELGQQVSETFYQWENELTEVYDLTQRINNEVSFTNRFTSQLELELSKLNAGFGDTETAISNIRSVLVRNNDVIKDQIKDQQQMIAARQRELEAALSYQDEVDKLNKFKTQTNIDSATKAKNIEWAQGLANGATLGYKYVKDIFKDLDGSIRYEIDWEQFNKDNEANPYSKDTYEAIKKYLDDLNDAATAFNDAIKEQTDFIKQTYDALQEYQDYIANFEDTLVKGLEEEIENATQNAKKLSDSIANHLKNLLDEVKRKLDERRKQEDNAKTERDISQKQQRLAALRADTAGGHQVEIAQLEKEIAEAQQSYQRTLEDQLLDKLQQQADEAQKQRERQIELAETSNELLAANNKLEVDKWLRDPEKYKEQIKQAWLEANGYDEKGEAGQYVLENQFKSDFAELVTAVGQTNFKDHFSAITADANSLVALLQELTHGDLGREDELAKNNNALLDATKRNTTSILTEMQQGASTADLKDQGVDAATMKTMGRSAAELKDTGYSAAELKDAGYTVDELKDLFTPDVLKNIGYSAREINDAGASVKDAGFTARDLHNEGFQASEIAKKLGLKLKDFVADSALWKAMSWAEVSKQAGFTIEDYVNAGIKDATSLKKAGFNLNDLKANSTVWKGNSWAAIKNAGYTAADYKAAGLTYANAIASGFTDNQLKGIYSESGTLTAYNQLLYDRGNKKKTKDKWWGKIGKDAYAGQVNRGKILGKTEYQVAADLAATEALTWKEVLGAAKAAGRSGKTVKSWNPNASKSSNFRKAFESVYGKWSKFARGGLANFTGPAWLDGTPSKPELILNAKDTKNFIALRDVLSSAMNATSSTSNSYGDIMYEININVDKIEKDYDVDRVVEKVKKEIVKGSGYRNVTQVRNFK